MKKHLFRLLYVLGLCILLLLLFNTGFAVKFAFFELFDVPYDGVFSYIAEIIVQAAAFVVVIGVGLKYNKKTLASVCFFKKVNGGVWFAAILCSIGFVLFNFYLHFLFYSFYGGWRTYFSETEGNFFYNLLNAALIPAVAEELLFKGLIFTVIRKYYSSIIAIIIVSLMFAVCHLQFIRIIPLFLFSCFTFWLYLRSGSLILPMFLHFINNLFAFVLISEPFASLGTFYAALALFAIGSYMLHRLSMSEKTTKG
jgi:membrane protease YdiL (CAAX protease family)